MPKRTSSRTPGRRITAHPVLRFPDADPVEFFFEGRRLEGKPGDTIAAALVANGIDVFRHTERQGRARGFFCAVGKCSSCLMVVDDRPNTMVCMEPLRPGARVRRQRGDGRLT
jgi:hypothetical protein